MSEELNPGFELVNNLVKNCKSQITGQRHIAGYHCGPFSPILFVTFGDVCKKQNVEIIKETIELAWNNIQGNLIILQYPDAVDKNTLIHHMDESIAKLKSVPDGIFSTYISTKVFVFLDSDDEKYAWYIKLLEGSLLEHFEQLQIVVVAKINEKTSEKKKESRKKLSCLMRLKKELKIQGVLVLSNVLRNGRILSSDAELDQYRIAANIAYLSNSYELSTGMEYMISREICETLFGDNMASTAAYIRLSKPSGVIARTALRKIMDIHEEKENERILSNDFDSSSHGFRKKIAGDKEDGAFGLEKLFRNEVCKEFPSMIVIDDFPYFQEVKDLKKNGANSQRELDSQMDTGTMGIWKLFIQYNFIDKVEHYIQTNKEKIYQHAKAFLTEKLMYKELVNYMSDPVTKESILKDMDTLDSGPMGMESIQNVNVMLLKNAQDKARKVFFKEAGAICKEAFLDYWEEVKVFSKIVRDIRQLLNIGFVPNSVSNYYEDKVNYLFDYEKFSRELNHPCNTMKEYCSILEKLFERFAHEYPRVFMASFEDELSARIDSSATGTILDELGFRNKRLEDECRFEYGEIPVGSSYCIAFAQADFVKNLQEQENTMGKVFKTSRQESVERIMLCSFFCNDFILEGDEQ